MTENPKKRFSHNHIDVAPLRRNGDFMEKKKENPDILFLQDVYKSVSLRADILTSVLGKTENDELKAWLSAAIDTFGEFAERASRHLTALSAEAKELGMLEKIPSEISVNASMMTDRCTPKIAELVIEGAVASVSEYKEKIRDADRLGVSLEHIRLAGDVLSFHEETINKMRPYL